MRCRQIDHPCGSQSKARGLEVRGEQLLVSSSDVRLHAPARGAALFFAAALFSVLSCSRYARLNFLANALDGDTAVVLNIAEVRVRCSGDATGIGSGWRLFGAGLRTAPGVWACVPRFINAFAAQHAAGHRCQAGTYVLYTQHNAKEFNATRLLSGLEASRGGPAEQTFLVPFAEVEYASTHTHTAAATPKCFASKQEQDLEQALEFAGKWDVPAGECVARLPSWRCCARHAQPAGGPRAPPV